MMANFWKIDAMYVGKKFVEYVDFWPTYNIVSFYVNLTTYIDIISRKKISSKPQVFLIAPSN